MHKFLQCAFSDYKSDIHSIGILGQAKRHPSGAERQIPMNGVFSDCKLRIFLAAEHFAGPEFHGFPDIAKLAISEVEHQFLQ